jgi:hypothetical protein
MASHADTVLATLAVAAIGCCVSLLELSTCLAVEPPDSYLTSLLASAAFNRPSVGVHGVPPQLGGGAAKAAGN